MALKGILKTGLATMTFAMHCLASAETSQSGALSLYLTPDTGKIRYEITAGLDEGRNARVLVKKCLTRHNIPCALLIDAPAQGFGAVMDKIAEEKRYPGTRWDGKAIAETLEGVAATQILATSALALFGGGLAVAAAGGTLASGALLGACFWDSRQDSKSCSRDLREIASRLKNPQPGNVEFLIPSHPLELFINDILVKASENGWAKSERIH